MRFYIVLDSKYNTINRTVYSMTDMFGQIGGMDSILVSAGSILVGIFSSKIFMSSLISTFYYVVSENQDSKVFPDSHGVGEVDEVEEVVEPEEAEEVKEEQSEKNNYRHDSANESQIKYEQSIE